MRFQVFCAIVGLAAAVPGVVAQPINDACGNAIAISDGVTAGTTAGASNDGAGTCGSSTSSPDVWYRFTAAEDALLSVSTCGSGYDTVLGIWSDCPGSGSELACNDDSCGLQSFTSFNVTAGNDYYIRVSGYSGDSGAFTLDLQTEDVGNTTGADVIYSDVQSISNWGSNGGIQAYSLGSYTCNIGDVNLQWGGTAPLLAMNAYRLHEGRLLQVGMSFVKNGTVAAANNGCGPPCNGQGGSVLGAGCLDVYSSGFNGIHSILGPRSTVNPFTGAYPGASGGNGDDIYKRLQIHQSDLGQSDDGALYFVEGQYVAADDAASGNAMNNASYKRVTVSSGSLDMTPTGPMFDTIPAIYAWRDHGLGVGVVDESVQVVVVDVPDEGRFHVASKVTELPKGQYRYDYAVRNLNSDRAASSVSVPIPAGASISGVGFHDVDYHSGEPYDDAPWVVDEAGGSLTWRSPATIEENPDTNALRWGTMYNFWFEVAAPPVEGELAIGLFRPGVVNTVTGLVQVPSTKGGGCDADINSDGVVDVTDLVSVITNWGLCGAPCDADTNDDGVVDVTDLVAVITNWGPC